VGEILDRNIKQTGLENIRRPSISINDTVHNQRAGLLQMIWHVKMTLEWLPPSIRAELVTVKGGFARIKVYWVFELDLATDPGASQCARETSHGFFHPSISSIGVIEAGSIKE
jgi:hypothetical protein